MTDKRLFARFKIHCDCSFAFKDDFKVFDAALEDLSLGGLRISTFTPLSIGQEVYFTISTRPPIKGLAQIVWVRKEGKRFTAGLKIEHMNQKFQRTLQDLINELTLKTLPSSYLR